MSEHFSEEELCRSEYALRHDIPNVPDKEILIKLETLAERVLEPLRAAIGHPILITSGYRSKEVNRLIGGSPNSQHMKGEAVDTICLGLSVQDYYRKIKQMVLNNELTVDQVIFEFGSWVHISYREKNNRNQLLIASKISGSTKYFTAR